MPAPLWKRGISLSPLASLGAPAASAVSACAGGVCTVAAPAATSLLAASSGSAGSLLALAGQGFALPAHAQFPVWNLVSAALLLFAFAWDTWQFARGAQPGRALLLTVAALWLVFGELWRLPFGHPQSWQWIALATGLPFFLALPVTLSEGRQTLLRRFAAGAALVALLFVAALQIFAHMEPCPLCWMQRLSLLGFLLTVFLPRLRVAAMPLLAGGLLSAAWQFLEVSRSVRVSGLCTAGVSCVAAGATPILGIPVIDASLVFFSVLLTAALLWQRRIQNPQQKS